MQSIRKRGKTTTYICACGQHFDANPKKRLNVTKRGIPLCPNCSCQREETVDPEILGDIPSEDKLTNFAMVVPGPAGDYLFNAGRYKTIGEFMADSAAMISNDQHRPLTLVRILTLSDKKYNKLIRRASVLGELEEVVGMMVQQHLAAKDKVGESIS